MHLSQSQLPYAVPAEMRIGVHSPSTAAMSGSRIEFDTSQKLTVGDGIEFTVQLSLGGKFLQLQCRGRVLSFLESADGSFHATASIDRVEVVCNREMLNPTGAACTESGNAASGQESTGPSDDTGKSRHRFH
jgi:hypothetical protein